MRRRARPAAILAILAVTGAAAVLLTTRTAAAFPPGTCNGSACTGSTTDSFAGVNVCEPGTTVYWEDSYIPADVTNVRLAKFTVTPNPPCSGATVGTPTSDPWPASPKDPDGQTPKGEPGKKTFRFRFAVTVPSGSTSNGTMNVAWTLVWTKASSGGVTETTPASPCPTSGVFPAHCRYDLEVSIAAPDSFLADRVHMVRLKITVYNNGPAASLPLAHGDGHLQFQGHYANGHGSHAIRPTGPGQCTVDDISVSCPVRSLRPRGEETFTVGVLWSATSKHFFDEDRKNGKVFLRLNARVYNHDCAREETSCDNNATEEMTAAR